jgi:NUMOD3 motif-containing protein
MSGFVYIWLDRKHRRFYIGSHWGSENDGYVCSSSWMKQAYRCRPEDFRRRILSVVESNRKDLLDEEERWLQMMKPEELRFRYYNLHRTTHHWAADPEKRKTVAEKSGATQRAQNALLTPDERSKKFGYWKGKPGPSIGKVLSEETKRKIGDKSKGRPSANKGKKLGPSPMRGKTYSEEVRRRMSLAHIGKSNGPHSEETKQKIRDTKRKLRDNQAPTV